ISSLLAVASVIIVADSTTSLQVGTDKALEFADDNNLPRFIFVNKIDSEKADYYKVLDELKQRYGKKIAPFHIPWGKGDSFKGYINVVDLFAKKYNGKNCDIVDMPDDINDELEPVRAMLMEAVAESDEDLLEKYFNGETFTQQEIHRGLRKGVISGDIIPVLCGSTAKSIGIHTLLDMIADFLPSPLDKMTIDKKEFEGQIFKTLIDSFVGRVSYLKVIQGSLRPDMEVNNLNKRTKEKIGKIYTVTNNGLEETELANAGDIVAITKLQTSLTGDTLAEKLDAKTQELPKFPKPQMLVAIEPLNKGDDEKILQGLNRLMDEDQSFTWERNPETKQTVVGVQGDIHINSIKDKLKEKFGVDVKIEDLKVPYRETIKGKSDVQGKHKKQSGGHGQYGDVKIRFEPSDKKFEFTEELFGGSVPKSYVPAVEKGLIESMEKGVLAGYPMTNLKATLYDGSYHDVDSSEMAFKIAANLAYKKGIEEAHPILLEPIMDLTIIVPDEYMGDVIGDINRKRGRVLGMEAYKQGKQIIKAQAPEVEIFKYAIDLKALTQGQGYFEMEFNGYEEVPSQLAEKIISDAHKESSKTE
ncbi:elongation factor G, partial [Criibacterium bergeronii]